MLRDIFSSFDEHNGNLVGEFFIWFFGFFFVYFIVRAFWVGSGRLEVFYSLVVGYLWGQVFSRLGGQVRCFSFFVTNFFFFLVFCNLLGLIPYVFRRTRHLVVSFSMAVPLWFSLLLSRFF